MYLNYTFAYLVIIGLFYVTFSLISFTITNNSLCWATVFWLFFTCLYMHFIKQARNARYSYCLEITHKKIPEGMKLKQLIRFNINKQKAFIYVEERMFINGRISKEDYDSLKDIRQEEINELKLISKGKIEPEVFKEHFDVRTKNIRKITSKL